MAQQSNPELEAAIRANPGDPKAYLVYADWLQTSGDPRGELIALQHRRIEEPGNLDLEQAEVKLLTENVERFFGPEHPQSKRHTPAISNDQERGWRYSGAPAGTWRYGHFAIEWYCGFVRKLWFEPGYYGDDASGEECVAILQRFLQHPSAVFLRELYIGDIWDDTYEGPDLGLAASVVAESPIPAQLEALEFIGGEHDISGVQLDAGRILEACKKLERLQLYGGQITIGEIDLPRLKRFAVHSGSLGADSLVEIARAKWPQLEDLELWFGSSNYGASGGVGEIQPILDGAGLAQVKRLGLMNSEFADDICAALPNSTIVKQLSHLDLSMGIMTGAGAKALLENASKFAHLESLNLDRNFIEDEHHEALQKLCKSVNLGRQEDGDYRYVAVGE